MKTSTLLIITAILLTLGCLTAFDIDMKKTYLSGNYKNRFKDMEFVPLTAVQNLKFMQADMIGIKIEKGDKEGIWVGKHLKGKIAFKMNADELTLGLSDEGKETKFNSYTNEVIIITKKLNTLSAQPSAKKDEGKRYGTTPILISGYQSGSLDLHIGSGLSVSLDKMRLNLLKALIGDKHSVNAELSLSSDIRIDSARFTIPGAGRLTLLDPGIVKTSYDLSDRATVTLSGKLVHLVK